MAAPGCIPGPPGTGNPPMFGTAPGFGSGKWPKPLIGRPVVLNGELPGILVGLPPFCGAVEKSRAEPGPPRQGVGFCSLDAARDSTEKAVGLWGIGLLTLPVDKHSLQ